MAGAYNALFGFARTHADALNQDIVVEQLKECLRERIQGRTRK